jgi:Fe-S cluster assembly protein SufD
MTLHVLKHSGLTFDAEAYLRGLPLKSNERWKYTDLSLFDRQAFALSDGTTTVTQEVIDGYRLKHSDAVFLVLIDGVFHHDFSDLANLPKEVIACGMQDARIHHADLVNQYYVDSISKHDYPFAALNTAELADGLFLYIPKGMQLSTPLHILSLSAAEQPVMTRTQNLFVCDDASRTTLFQEYVGLHDVIYFTNVVTMITAKQSSHLTLVKSQRDSQHAVHMENYFVQQAAESDISVTQITTGAQLSRDDLVISLNESGAICRTSGFYHTSRDGQYIDNHIDVKHAAPRTNSEMLYKGIADKKSRVVFNGSLYVAKDAQKINAVQGNHTLLLSNQAEAYSKPELEIYADDVKCRHGATTGQIDQDALFYMRARGIDHASAVNLLLKGFAEEVLQRIVHPDIAQHAMKQVTFR